MKKYILFLLLIQLLLCSCGKKNVINSSTGSSINIETKENNLKDYDITLKVINISEYSNPINDYPQCSVIIEISNNGKKDLNGINGSIDIIENDITIKTEENIDIPFIYSHGGKFYKEIYLDGKKEDVSNYTFQFHYEQSEKYEILPLESVSIEKCYYKNNSPDDNSENNFYANVKNNTSEKIEIMGMFIIKSKGSIEYYVNNEKREVINGNETKRIWLGGCSEPYSDEKGEYIITNVYKKK